MVLPSHILLLNFFADFKVKRSPLEPWSSLAVLTNLLQACSCVRFKTLTKFQTMPQRTINSKSKITIFWTFQFNLHKTRKINAYLALPITSLHFVSYIAATLKLTSRQRCTACKEF